MVLETLIGRCSVKKTECTLPEGEVAVVQCVEKQGCDNVDVEGETRKPTVRGGRHKVRGGGGCIAEVSSLRISICTVVDQHLHYLLVTTG